MLTAACDGKGDLGKRDLTRMLISILSRRFMDINSIIECNVKSNLHRSKIVFNRGVM